MTLHPSHPPPPPSARPLFQQSQPSSTTTHPFLSSSSSSKPSTQNKGSTSSGSQPDTPPLIISPRSSSSAAAPPPSTGALPQSYTTQLSDLLLSAVVPGIPKGTAAGKGAGGKASGGGVKAGDVVGGVRVLSSKKEELNLSSMTNNFRKFVLKIGWLFALQDRVEEVVFWKKPSWSVLFLICWTIISFNPHLILPLPPLIFLIILLSSYGHPTSPPSTSIVGSEALQTIVHPRSRDSSPSNEKTLFRSSASASTQHGRSVSMSEGSPGSPLGAGRERIRKQSEFGLAHHPHSTLTPQHPPAAPPPNLSSLYYANLQGIQNLMGVFADLHDASTPYLAYLSPSHPLHHLLLLACLLSVFGLGLIGWLIPGWALMLPLGWMPLIVGGLPVSFPLPPPVPKALTRPLHTLHLALLNDQLPMSYIPSSSSDSSADDPSASALTGTPTTSSTTSAPSPSLLSLTTLLSPLSTLLPSISPLGPAPSLYPISLISLYENERYRLLNPKDPNSGCWQPDPQSGRWSGRNVGSQAIANRGGEVLIGLEQLDFSEESGWMWVPGEEFNLDRVGDWVGSEGGEGGKVDSDGWTYTSPLQATPSSFAYEIPGSNSRGVPGDGDVQIGSLRRRRWWRRAVKID